MKVAFILIVTAIVMCVRNRTHGVHRHRHAHTGQKPEGDTGSIILKPGTAKNNYSQGMEQILGILEKSRMVLYRATVVTSIPIPKYSDTQKRPIIFNNCTEDLQQHGARTRGYPEHETYKKCNRVSAEARFYQTRHEEL